MTTTHFRIVRRFGEIWIESTDANGRWVIAEEGCPSYATMQAAAEAMERLMEAQQ